MDVASYVAGKICRWRFLGEEDGADKHEKIFLGFSGIVACRKSLRSDLSIIVSMSSAVSVRPRRMAFLDIAFILFLSSTVS